MTPDQMRARNREIIALHASGLKQSAIAAQFDLHESRIFQIVHGRTGRQNYQKKLIIRLCTKSRASILTEAKRRKMRPEALIQQVFNTVAAEGLFAAILDSGERAA